MIWKTGTLYAQEDSGEADELGNPVMVLKKLWSGSVRFSPWTNEELELESRSGSLDSRYVMQNVQKFAVPVDYETVETAQKIELDGVMQDVTMVSELGPRWTVIRAEVYKQ